MDNLIVNNNDSSSEFSFIDDNDVVGENRNSKKPAEQNRTLSNDERTRSSIDSTGAYSKHSKRIPRISIPGDFDFIDDINPSPLSYYEVPVSLQNGIDPAPQRSPQSCSSSSPVIFKIPSIYLPSNLQYIDDEATTAGTTTGGRTLHRDRDTHCSLRVPTRKHSAKQRHLSRHHSDSEAKATSVARSRHHRARSRRVRRSISAIETQKEGGYRPHHVRRTASDRSGMIVAGKHLLPPRYGHYENCSSSRCSSTRTLSTNVSISEIVAVEMGFKDIPGLTSKEARRRRIVCTVVVVTVTIVIICVLLLAVTLLLSPEVDALLRKENEEIYRSMAAGASTSSPTTEGAAVVVNNSAPPSGNPG